MDMPRHTISADVFVGGTVSISPRFTRTITQIVVVQLALALAITGLAAGVAWAVPALLVAFLFVVLAAGRLRRRWTFEWLAHGSRYLSRARTLAPGADAAKLLDFVRPAAMVTTVDVDGASVGVVEDPLGLTALVEVGDSSALLGDPNQTVPELTALLPVHAGLQPSMRIQLVISGVAAPSVHAGAGAAGTSTASSPRVASSPSSGS